MTGSTSLTGACAPLLLVLVVCQRCLALPTSSSSCDVMDCGFGFCIEKETAYGRQLCVCLDGYEGENCEKRVSRARKAKREVCAECEAEPCKNGGTCVPIIIGKTTGEAPMGEGEADIDGEAAPVETGEAPVEILGESEMELMSDTVSEGGCLYTCVCAPGFTGHLCSETLGNII